MLFLRYAPGQFTMLYVFGIGEIPDPISGDPSGARPSCRRSAPSARSARRSAELEVGDTLGVRGPFGTAWPVAEGYGSDVVVVAGGFGLAPLRPALYQLLAQRKRFGKLVLLYGTRRPEDILFRRQLANWRKQLDMESRSPWTTHRRMARQRRRGHQLIPRHSLMPQNSVALVCGPEMMMRFSVAEFIKRGYCTDDVFHLAGAQHEVRGRIVRPLPVRAVLHLQGRRGVAL